MSIVVVGGHERMHNEYKGIAKSMGHKLKVFTKMPARFEKAIGRPDAMLLFTSTVSHKMVGTALKEAKKKKIPLIRSHSSSASSLAIAIKELSQRL